MKKYFFLFATIIILMSCNDMETAHISGTVTEKGTGQPFSNVPVKIERTNRSGMNSQTDPTIIASTTTDQNGEYGLTFDMEKKYVYKVSCWPAKEASGKSSAVALERTATGRLFSANPACVANSVYASRMAA